MAIISVVFIVLILFFFMFLFYYLFKVILAFVIMVVVFGLIDIKEVKYFWIIDWVDFWMFVVIFVGMFFFGIE